MELFVAHPHHPCRDSLTRAPWLVPFSGLWPGMRIAAARYPSYDEGTEPNLTASPPERPWVVTV